MGLIVVEQPGTFTTVQDTGRKLFQCVGVPESGAVDKFSLRCANLLVGNSEDDPALEATLFGPRMRFDTDTVISVTGGDLGPLIDGRPVENWQSIPVSSGSILSFGGPRAGIRSYIGVAGGMFSESMDMVMGSYSTYVPGSFGGFNGRPLLQGDTFFLGQQGDKPSEIKILNNPPTFSDNVRLRVLLGPQEELFSDDSFRIFTDSEYTVSMNSDRMGIRLEGAPLRHRSGADVVSDGTAFGAIQVPGDGLPIILSADRGTTGGYAKIATVISADHSLMGQLVPGNKIRFDIVTMLEALKALERQEFLLDSLRLEKRMPGFISVSDYSVSVATVDGNPVAIPGAESSYVATVKSEYGEEEVEVHIKGSQSISKG